MTKQASFAGIHTEEKLVVLTKYLKAYQTALKKQDFETVFFDAFAGTGVIPIGIDDGGLLDDVEDLDCFMSGSSRRALKIEPPFSRYVFVEQARGKAEELARDLKRDFAHLAPRIDVINGDANEQLITFCNSMRAKTRAVVFLDPFGNQVSWDTVVAVAKTGAIDLWYLFPSALGINRQISQSGVVEDEKAASLDKVLGTRDWREAFIKRETVTDLLGEREIAVKQANADIITRFMIERMKTVFKGGVLDSWLPLGRNGHHWYSLLFACANRRAWELASRIAKDVMKRK